MEEVGESGEGVEKVGEKMERERMKEVGEKMERERENEGGGRERGRRELDYHCRVKCSCWPSLSSQLTSS